MKTLEKLFIPKNLPIDKIINHMNDNSNYDLPKGILLVVDSNNYLLGTITDGDIRRVYRKENQKIVANEIMNNKPLTFLDDTPYETIIMEIPKRLKNRKDTSRKFLSNIFGVQQAQDDLIEINKYHTDKYQRWVKDPNITRRHKRTKTSIDQVEESQKKS